VSERYRGDNVFGIVQSGQPSGRPGEKLRAAEITALVRGCPDISAEGKGLTEGGPDPCEMMN
jgi:hypothetical protein